MSTVTKPIMLDETGKELVAEMRKQNAFLSAMAREAINSAVSSWEDIHNIVRGGYAADIFHIGDQIIVPWTDKATGTEYEVPLDVVHFGDVTLQTGEVVPGMYLQWHYALPFGIQFDHAENEVATESVFQSGYHYYKSDGTYMTPGTDYNVGDTIPSGTYYHSAIYDVTGGIVGSGYEVWSHSGIRQFLNSAEGVGDWWSAYHLGDVAPDEVAAKAGFMSGFSEDFLACLKPVRVATYYTGHGIDEAYDTFFLPSLEQIYTTPRASGVEGEAFEYWRQALGISSPAVEGNAYDAYKTYAIDATASSRIIRLRSEYQHSKCHTMRISPAGIISAYDACDSISCTPVCVVC